MSLRLVTAYFPASNSPLHGGFRTLVVTSGQDHLLSIINISGFGFGKGPELDVNESTVCLPSSSGP